MGYQAGPSSGKLVYLTDHHGIARPTETEKQPVQKNGEEMIALEALFTTGCLCNNATRVQEMGAVSQGHCGGALSGQPTELALLVASEKAGFHDARPNYIRLQETPFTSERKMMEVRARPVSGIHTSVAFTLAVQNMANDSPRARQTSRDGSLCFVKGMPEKVLGECATYVATDGRPEILTEEGRTKVLKQARSIAASGLRVLAFAFGATVDADLTFAGLMGMEDPPREGVEDCVKQLRRGGVKVMMVTGDSKETALAIARRCGILGSEHDNRAPSSGGLDDLIAKTGDDSLIHSSSEHSLQDVEFGASVSLSGAELDAIATQNLAKSLSGVKVFYRVVPRHKLAIVQALQETGEIVAMTGKLNECRL